MQNIDQKSNLMVLLEGIDHNIIDVDSLIDVDSVLNKLMNDKRNYIKKCHPYAITAPSSVTGRWQTCYKGADGTRKNIKAQTEEELLDKLIPV
ncbi:MAG: hypothetical protein RR590_10605, partial [Hungatella sp.]